MSFPPSKRKLSGSDLSTSSKRSKRESEDHNSSSNNVTISNPYALHLSACYDRINERIRKAVCEARRIRQEQVQPIKQYDITEDKKAIERHYAPINDYLKNVQFNT